jgi:hypothetical protein
MAEYSISILQRKNATRECKNQQVEFNKGCAIIRTSERNQSIIRFRDRTIDSLLFQRPTYVARSSHALSRPGPHPVLPTMQHPMPLACSCVPFSYLELTEDTLALYSAHPRELAEPCLQPCASPKSTFAIPHIKTSRKHLKKIIQMYATSHETLCNMKKILM